MLLTAPHSAWHSRWAVWVWGCCETALGSWAGASSCLPVIRHMGHMALTSQVPLTGKVLSHPNFPAPALPKTDCLCWSASLAEVTKRN